MSIILFFQYELSSNIMDYTNFFENLSLITAFGAAIFWLKNQLQEAHKKIELKEDQKDHLLLEQLNKQNDLEKERILLLNRFADIQTETNKVLMQVNNTNEKLYDKLK